MSSQPLSNYWPLPIALGLSFSGWAQTPPDAGTLRQQIEQQRPLLLPEARPKSTPLPPKIEPSSGMTVMVKSFRFAGNSLLSSDELTPPLQAFVGQQLNFAGLQRAADAVATAYRQAGWIVRVYIPEQDISKGILTLQVVEAKFAGLRFEGEVSKRVARNPLQAYFSQQQEQGKALDADALDRALLLADDLPGISVAGTLVPGASEGETALALQTTDERLIDGDIGLDNAGAKTIGGERLTVNLNINSPGGRGDLLTLTGLLTKGSAYGRIAYTRPLGYSGLRMGISASKMQYKVVDGPPSLRDLNIQGSSASIGQEWSYPLVRTRLHNVYFSGGLEAKNFYGDNSSTTPDDAKSYSDYNTNAIRLGLSGNRFDQWGRGGANSASIQWLQGRLSNMQAHSLIDSIDRSFSKINYSLARQQSFTGAHSVLLSLQGQHANQALDSSEKFYIGGLGTVRAYPVSELGGERGQVFTAEWRWRINPNWVLSGFIDHGRVASLPIASGDATRTLSLNGHGLSASWQGLRGIATRITWAQRNGNNPNPTASGTDSDGTLKSNRVWLSANVPY